MTWRRGLAWRAAGLAALAVAAVLVAGLAIVVLDPGPTPSDRTRPAANKAPEPKPARAKPLRGEVEATIGVASFNVYHHLRAKKAREDLRRLTNDPRIDLIGWQETKRPFYATLFPALRERGWETWQDRSEGLFGPMVLAMSWRADTFSLLNAQAVKVAPGRFRQETDAPFGPRWLVIGRFLHLPTQRTVTLVNTHLPYRVEIDDGFQDNVNAEVSRLHIATLAELWPTVEGDVVVGTGDYNFDYVDDSRARPRGGITRRFQGKATSSFTDLGTDGLLPTHGSRWIDYVFLADHTRRTRTDRAGHGRVAQFATHRVLDSYHSDHRPVLARIRLYRVQ